MSRRRHKGVIFDLDGTLADSRLDYARMRVDLGLAPATPILEALAAEPNAAVRERGHAIILEHELAGARAATAMPGAVELVAELRAQGMRCGVFTRNARAVTELTLARLGLVVDHVVAREDAPPKPDPTGLLRICQAWGVEVGAVVYVGDYLYDLEAGRNAGMRTVLYAPAEPDFAHDCGDVIRSLAELWEVLGAANFDDHPQL